MPATRKSRSFVDNTGRRWSILITDELIQKIRADTEVDLWRLGDKKHRQALTDEPAIMVAAIYAACEADAEARGVNPTDFGRSLLGSALDRAYGALLESLIDNYPEHIRKRLRREYHRRQRRGF